MPTIRAVHAGVFRCLLALACCIGIGIGIGTAAAQELGVYTVTFAPGVPRAQAIPPGGEGTLSLTVSHNGPNSGIASIHGRIDPDPAVLAEYSFVANEPNRCLPPDIVTQQDYPSIRLRIGPLAAASSQTCTYRVRRSAASRNDLRFRLCGSLQSFPYCDRVFHFGTLPTLHFRVAPVDSVEHGAATALVRLIVDNPGTRDVLRRNLTTECAEFVGGLHGPSPYEVETDFAGGCPRADHGEACLNFTGQNFDSRHFAPGPIPAGGSASCLVRLRFRSPLTQVATLQMRFRDEVVSFADGGIGYDPASDLATAPFGAGPTSAVPLGRAGLAVMALLLALAGWAALRQPGVKPALWERLQPRWARRRG